METHLRAALDLQALDMAVRRRRPNGKPIHPDQSDRRLRTVIATSYARVLRRPIELAQYTSLGFGARCRKFGVRPSMGLVGDCYDNAMAESFFATLECELIDRRRFDDPDHARREIFRFIEGWYNPRPRHSAIGYKSPINYERSIPPVALTFNSPRKRGNSSSTMRLRTSREPGPRRPRHIASRRSSTRFRAGRRYLLHADPVRSSHPPPPPPGQGGQHGFDRGSRRCSDAQYRIP